MVWRVARRDLLATVRDRRTLTSTILVPLLIIPLLTMGMPLLMGGLLGQQASARQKVGVVGALPASLTQALTRDEPQARGQSARSGVELVPVGDPMKAVQSGQVDAVVVAASPPPTRAGNGQGELRVYAKLGNYKTQAGAFGKIQDTVDAYNHALTLSRLKSLGLGENVLTPLRLTPVDASLPQEQKSGQLAFLIPMLMLQFILSGAMATALDGTAGEKERGTLESLLVSPVRRSEVVAGKLLATTLTALITAGFSLLGFLLAGLASAGLSHGAGGAAAQALGGQLTLTPTTFLALLLMVLSAALLISGLLIALSIYARSYKEAQTYVTPLSLLIVFPAVALQFADFLKLSDAVYLTPLFGSMIGILDTVKGSITVGHTLSAVAGNLLGALLCGWLALKSFGREEVIFRN
ncbi:ABC transporter permease [Deinococcus sp.]|uniref:ABC transporter permease n=1 Tax=Deinococcus sp. TaxID=47478 RepID=UPI0025C03600|nr:ABC transporter permease [Deinococcus sp.]